MFEYEVKFYDGLVTVVVTAYVDDRTPTAAIERALGVVVENSGVSFDVEDCRRVEVEYIGADRSWGEN
jgi:hypothetical protein